MAQLTEAVEPQGCCTGGPQGGRGGGAWTLAPALTHPQFFVLYLHYIYICRLGVPASPGLQAPGWPVHTVHAIHPATELLTGVRRCWMYLDTRA